MLSEPTVETGVSDDKKAPAIDSVVKQAVSNWNEENEFKFLFDLSEDGLALHSAALVDGVPELRFKASPKVPTISEQDVATIFRLVKEDKRPGFFYHGLPLDNPLSHSRLFTLYDPQWLRWTDIGKLLADVDWLMKCLHIGAKSNEDKTIFQAWEKSSQLTGELSTREHFPEDGRGPTIMSCDSATVEKSEDEIVFPEEPKMKITDGCSSLYSKYATEIYDSVAYYDEPRFLKMKEVIKLILAVEWLYKEKGVRVSEEWMMMHTSKPADKAKAIEAADCKTESSTKPPYDMVPKPTVFNRPSSDVTAKTWEAEMHNFLRKEKGVGRRYGYYDFGDAEAVMFEEDGTPCPPQKCLKLGLNCQLQALNGLISFPEFTGWCYVLLSDQTPESAMAKFRESLLKELPESSCREIALPLPMSIDTKVDDFSNDSGVDIKVTEIIHPCPPLALPPVTRTMVAKATVDNYNMLYGSKDPNEPIQPEIPGVCEAIIPNVNSWDEFISEMTVPQPRSWQAPYIGIGEPSAWGGVTTSSFRTTEKPPRSSKEKDRAFEEEGVYRGYGKQIGVMAKRLRTHIKGAIRLLNSCLEEFKRISQTFTTSWDGRKGPCPSIASIFTVKNDMLEREWTAYGRTVREKGVEQYFHGTMLACDITRSCQLCNKGECGICGIANDGLDSNCISKESFQRFGKGFYLAPNSSKCHDYTRTTNGYVYKAMLLCDVHPGRKYHLQNNRRNLRGPPQGFDSVYGQVGEQLNYPEIVVYNAAAVMPRYIIVYNG